MDPAFTKVNRLFVFSFARNDEGDDRDSFQIYHLPKFEIKYSTF